jgi:hypothetical protein
MSISFRFCVSLLLGFDILLLRLEIILVLISSLLPFWKESCDMCSNHLIGDIIISSSSRFGKLKLRRMRSALTIKSFFTGRLDDFSFKARNFPAKILVFGRQWSLQ